MSVLDETSRMRVMIALAATLLVVLAAGCGRQGSPSTASHGGSDIIGTGKAADYDFTATMLDGSTFDGTSLEGKPAVLWSVSSGGRAWLLRERAGTQLFAVMLLGLALATDMRVVAG